MSVKLYLKHNTIKLKLPYLNLFFTNGTNQVLTEVVPLT